MPLKAGSRNVRQRTDQMDTFTRRFQLPNHHLGGDPGYSLTEDPGRLVDEALWWRDQSNQPFELVWGRLPLQIILCNNLPLQKRFAEH